MFLCKQTLPSIARNFKWAEVGRVREEYCAQKKQIKLPSQANLSKFFENMHNQEAIVYRGDKGSNRGTHQKQVDYILIYVLITVATWNYLM